MTANTITAILQDFEQHCEERLELGLEIARTSRARYGSRIRSSVPETSLTSELLHRFHAARLNNVKVFVPPEGITGSDIEIHILSGKLWIGLHIQAKKTSVESTGGHATIPNLGHPRKSGGQNHALIAHSKAADMHPLYLVYSPKRVVDRWREIGTTGATLVTAWTVSDAIERGFDEAETILLGKTAAGLSATFMPLDASFSAFARSLESLLGEDFEDRGTSDLWNGEPPIAGSKVPADVEAFFRNDVIPDRWTSGRGAIVIGLPD